MLLLAASLFFTEPAPLEMPRAEAFLVQEDGVRRLEDRYRRMDLWESQTVDGRWIDDAGRLFLLASIHTLPPSADTADTVSTRRSFRNALPRPDPKEPKALRGAIAYLSGREVAEEGVPIHLLPRAYADVDYWEGTNRSAIVCAFRPAKSKLWRLAVWLLAPEDDHDACREAFEKEFLRREYAVWARNRPENHLPEAGGERELLRADARHSVSAYAAWHVTETPEFSILDDLPARGFVGQLTNELTRMRAAYAATLPTALDGSNVLSVARLYDSRAEYLEALEADGAPDMRWSAAYWSPSRRELVAYLPEAGERELLKTFRHEAFHQYLSYATSMIAVSPWLNEGYAQYFEEGPDGPASVDPTDLAPLAEAIPALLAADYGAFYAGTDAERRAKYRLALSLAYFIERGTPKVRFQPFKNLKRDYFEALFETLDMRRATARAFRDDETLKLFISEWTKFWQNP